MLERDVPVRKPFGTRQGQRLTLLHAVSCTAPCPPAFSATSCSAAWASLCLTSDHAPVRKQHHFAAEKDPHCLPCNPNMNEWAFRSRRTTRDALKTLLTSHCWILNLVNVSQSVCSTRQTRHCRDGTCTSACGNWSLNFGPVDRFPRVTPSAEHLPSVIQHLSSLGELCREAGKSTNLPLRVTHTRNADIRSKCSSHMAPYIRPPPSFISPYCP